MAVNSFWHAVNIFQCIAAEVLMPRSYCSKCSQLGIGVGHLQARKLSVCYLFARCFLQFACIVGAFPQCATTCCCCFGAQTASKAGSSSRPKHKRPQFQDPACLIAIAMRLLFRRKKRSVHLQYPAFKKLHLLINRVSVPVGLLGFHQIRSAV